MSIDAGIILLWHGAIIDIPTGWALCDGNNGTPNLTAQFVLAAGGAVAVGSTGGAATHTHPFTTDGHDHDLLSGGDFVAAGTDYDKTTDSSVDTGTTGPGSSLPPYYALAYIMKT